MSNRDLTITLEIQTLRVPVNETMPVIVIWSRQSKKAQTKKRLLKEGSDTTVFNQSFDISTSMLCDDDGIPTKTKMSILTVASDKARGILGKCDLDMAKFSYDSLQVQRIELRECEFEGAWIEVGLKAAVATRSSTRNNNLNESYRSNTTSGTTPVAATADPAMSQQAYSELIDQFTDMKKKKRQMEAEKLKEIQQLQHQNNQLQTDFENAKVTTAGAQKRAKEATAKLETVLQQIEDQKTAMQDVSTQNEEVMETLKTKDIEIERVRNHTEKMEDEILGTGALMKQAQDETENAQEDFNGWYEISRYDTSFMGDIITLLQPPKKSSLRTQKTRSINRQTSKK